MQPMCRNINLSLCLSNGVQKQKLEFPSDVTGVQKQKLEFQSEVTMNIVRNLSFKPM